MNRTMNYSLIACATAVTLACHAEPVTMSIQDAAKSCIENNLEIKSTRYGQQMAEAKKDAAKSLSMPRFDLKPSTTWLPDPPKMSLNIPSLPITIPPIALGQEFSTRATLGLNLPLYTSGRIENAKSAADQGLRAVIESNKGKINNVVYDMGVAYYQAKLAQSVVEVHQSALDTVTKHVANAQSLFKAGTVARYDVLRAESELSAQQKRLTDASYMRDLAVSALLNKLNLPLDTQLVLSTPLSELTWTPSLPQTQSDAVMNSRELKALKLKTGAQESMAKVSAAGDKPQIALIAKQELLKDDLTLMEPQTTVILGMQWNFFDGGQSRAEAKELHAQAADTANTAQLYADGLKLMVQQAYQQLGSAQQGLISANKSVETAEEAQRLATKRFEVGAGTSVEQLDAILNVQNAQVQRQQALYQMDTAYLALRKLTDSLLDADAQIRLKD
ncbi:MAG: TolC family protein [Armatimonadota bacterium]